MKAYVATTGTVFGLIVLAHVARVVADHDRAMVTNPFFLGLTLLAAALCAWAVVLLRRLA